MRISDWSSDVCSSDLNPKASRPMVNLPRWQIILVALVVLAGVIFAAPNLLLTREQATRMADEGSILPHQQISLGLDLRGGVYLLVGVDLRSEERRVGKECGGTC